MSNRNYEATTALANITEELGIVKFQPVAIQNVGPSDVLVGEFSSESDVMDNKLNRIPNGGWFDASTDGATIWFAKTASGTANLVANSTFPQIGV